jgi:hypothetical protein
MSVTHLAGPVVGFQNGKRAIQRCAVCGHKLLDNLRMMAPVGPDGEPPVFPTWREGCLVEIDGNRQSDVGDFVEVERLPDDFCLALVEE